MIFRRQIRNLDSLVFGGAKAGPFSIARSH
jgi:hypothetical protein